MRINNIDIGSVDNKKYELVINNIFVNFLLIVFNLLYMCEVVIEVFWNVCVFFKFFRIIIFKDVIM